MNEGKVEQIGRPLELYDRPQNRFVAGFIGSPAMNFLIGRLAGSGSFEAEGGIQLAIAPKTQLAPGHPLVIGIRPEHLALGDKGITAEVVVVEPTGAEIQVNAKAANGDEIVAVFRERHEFTPGEKITLTPQAGSIHLFDGATGQRVS
jgi:multiple sugar transport system ATP-binding protein